MFQWGNATNIMFNIAIPINIYNAMIVIVLLFILAKNDEKSFRQSFIVKSLLNEIMRLLLILY